MVRFVRSLIGAAALLSVSSAAPMPKPDSAVGAEIPVSAPNGIPMSDAPAPTGSSNLNNGGGCDSGSCNKGDSSSQGGSYSQSSYGGSYNQGSSYGGSYNQGGYNSGGYSSSSQMDYSSSQDYSSSKEYKTTDYNTYSSPSYTSSAYYSMATYGSGSQSWGGSGYNDCVQQCAASFGGAPQTMEASPTQDGGSGGSYGSNGVTHTVIVAPSQGVLRYIPFSVNASVGDTVSFKWWGGPHTVTKSSALEVCNKTSDNPFASGQQEKGFTFNQVINDTKPTWIYCGVADHCQKGMFMGINIGQADPTGSSSGSSSSDYMPMSSVLSNMTSMSSDMSAMWSYTKSQTSGNSYANGWGMSTNMAGMSQDAMMQTAQNVMYMQTLIAKNPNNVQDGKFLASDNMMVPQDLQQALASTSANPAGASGANAGATPSGASSGAVSAAPASTSAPSNAASSGAGSIASSSVVVGLVAVVATFFAL